MGTRCPAVAVLLAALLRSIASTADDSTPLELGRCVTIAQDATRLACYDALAGRAPAAKLAAAALPEFGVVKPRLAQLPSDPQSMQAHITSISADHLRRDSLLLDNGQTWMVVDGNLYASPGDLVEIRHAALGSFMMSTPSRRSYRVHRVQ